MKNVKGALPQTSTRAYKKISEEYTLENVILEIAQNAFEHGNAGSCRVSYERDAKGRPSIRFFNNGNPMTEAQFQKFVSEYHCHDITNSTPSSGGVFTSLKGYALKDAVVFCSSDTGRSRVTFRNYCKDGKLREWHWTICKSNGDNGSYDSEVTVSTYDTAHSIGFEVCIENSKNFTETELAKAQRKVSASFPTEVISQGKTIQLFWKDKNSSVKLFDPMHFDLLNPLLPKGKTIYDCDLGEYISDDVIWFVKEDKFRGKNVDGEIVTVPVRTIAAYFNQTTFKKTHKFSKKTGGDIIATNTAGVYPLFGNSYLETGDNVRRHFGGSDNGGGAPRYRFCPIITEENKFLWGIKSIKNNGITPFDGNYLLCEEFKKVNDDGSMGETLYNYLYNSFFFLKRLHSDVIKYKPENLHSLYYKNNGFVNKELISKDIADFKNGSTKQPVIEGEREVILVEDSKDILYTLNEKQYIISKYLTESGMTHSLNTAAVGANYNEATKEDILYAVFDTLQEIGITERDYKELAKLLPSRIHHYEY